MCCVSHCVVQLELVYRCDANYAVKEIIIRRDMFLHAASVYLSIRA